MTHLAVALPNIAGVVAVCLLGVIVLLFALDRVGLWMERRGWIYYRKVKPKRGGGGGAMAGILTDFQKLVEPQTEARIQVMEERRTEASERLVRGDAVDPPNGNDPSQPSDPS
jgi:hypothetical protein